ncbi:hypothetical protein A3F66_05115 [candidate division TM6 bacterium RIFCSPHIGHO2_12_FULL_32_22]|nr:MAG: hypothetical protein A3F66_05115 [candidate division TM6 bacterium RIFCSPHIGHO2_12_FULL_32_22]
MKKIYVIVLLLFVNLSAVRYLETHYGRNFCDTLGDTSMRSKACVSNKIFVPEQSSDNVQQNVQPIAQAPKQQSVRYSYPVYNHYAYDRNYFDARSRGWLMGGGGVIDYNDPTLSDIVGAGMHPAEADNWSVYGDAGEKYQDSAFFR